MVLGLPSKGLENEVREALFSIFGANTKNVKPIDFSRKVYLLINRLEHCSASYIIQDILEYRLLSIKPLFMDNFPKVYYTQESVNNNKDILITIYYNVTTV